MTFKEGRNEIQEGLKEVQGRTEGCSGKDGMKFKKGRKEVQETGLFLTTFFFSFKGRRGEEEEGRKVEGRKEGR